MKILTLNLQLFQEEDVPRNQQIISKFISNNDIDFVFFQEVAQLVDNSIIINNIKDGNYALDVQEILSGLGHDYYLYYDYGNIAYNTVDDGLAIISKYEFSHKESFYVSRETSYDKWWTRKILKGSVNYKNELIDLVSVHLGWTEDEEVFEDQVNRLMNNINGITKTILAGDFNVGQDSKEYNYIVANNLYDLYYNGDEKYFNDVTHLPNIDVKSDAKRIDYVFSNDPCKTIDRRVVFKEVTVSDHFGVYIEIDW